MNVKKNIDEDPNRCQELIDKFLYQRCSVNLNNFMYINTTGLKHLFSSLVSHCVFEKSSIYIRVSCFAHTSPKNYATSGPHYVCYNRKSDWFSEFSSLIYYSEIKFPIYKGFLKIHKGKILFFEKFNFDI